MKLKHLKTWNYLLKEAAGWILGTLPASSWQQQFADVYACSGACFLQKIFVSCFRKVESNHEYCKHMSWKNTLKFSDHLLHVLLLLLLLLLSVFFHSSNAQALGTWSCFGTSHFFEIARTLRISYACCSKARNLRIWYAIQHRNWAHAWAHLELSTWMGSGLRIESFRDLVQPSLVQIMVTSMFVAPLSLSPFLSIWGLWQHTCSCLVPSARGSCSGSVTSSDKRLNREAHCVPIHLFAIYTWWQQHHHNPHQTIVHACLRAWALHAHMIHSRP